MKYLPYLILFFLLTITISVIGQKNIWPKTFEGYAFEDIEKTYDNGFAFSGFKTNDLDVYFLGFGVLRKVDINGDILWEKLIGLNPPPAYTDLYYVNQTNDGGYIVSGQFWGRDFDGGDVLIIKPNPANNYVILEYKLPKDINEGYFLLKSIDGINKYKIKLMQNQNEITLNLKDYISGVYLVMLYSNENETLKSVKMSIVK